MLRDRGTMKWTSLMLPEHVETLKRVWYEEDMTSPPILDEQALEEMQHKVNAAYQTKCPTTLTVYKNGCQKEIHGFVHRIDVYDQRIRLRECHATTSISIHEIIDVVLHEDQT
ncbi:hypothetical protein N781_02630 [Pontibacillus halophilus JSM 076056 = DSM 19796]|uniref:YolD-like protein n=1 Tax=Pontibacillus halophilus JSM 076056 = DSM 19796 TaxID=1385510 RepID=A0A0A5GJA5_9BACI|nr:YolD-like family protein [Pontibacillus halophilus]KGX92059.1 hypothetical protein N781_02630 [Pontibacillus halophilus JSM 076056 = DSM 19796]